MFEFFRAKSKVASASHPSQHRASRDEQRPTTASWHSPTTAHSNTIDGGYDDVSLSAESGDVASPTRASFSSPTTAHASFTNSYNPRDRPSTASYPPVATGHLPSTRGYPPLRSTFNRLYTILNDNSPSLLDSLSPPLPPSSPALLSLSRAISPYTLPTCVLEAYAIHDGQDPFASSLQGAENGLVWGLWWMPLDQVEAEWKFWRKLENSGGAGGMPDFFSAATSGGMNGGGGNSKGRMHPFTAEDEEDYYDEEERGGNSPVFEQGAMKSFPRGWVRRKYSHPGWLPLLTDRAGNYIGVDLDPPPPPPSSSEGSTSKNLEQHVDGYGQPGQVIAFGREMDEKVVLFPGDSNGGWGRFLSSFVDDLERGNFAALAEGGKTRDKKTKGGKSGNAWDDGERAFGGGSSEEDDEWGQGDGIGERSYFDGDRYGEEGGDDEEGARTETQLWTLRSDYRRYLSGHPESGLIGVIAERSRKMWRSVGVGLESSTTSVASSSHSQRYSRPQPTPSTADPSPSNVHSRASPLVVEVSPIVEEAGPLSGTTEKASPSINLLSDSPHASADQLSADDPESPDDPLQTTPTISSIVHSPHHSPVELVLSPPSPTLKSAIQPLPRAMSRNPSSQLLDDGRNSRRKTSWAESALRGGGTGGAPKARKRPPPPKPMPLDLPTAFDLVSTSIHDDEDEQYSNTSSNRNGRPRAPVRQDTADSVEFEMDSSSPRQATFNRRSADGPLIKEHLLPLASSNRSPLGPRSGVMTASNSTTSLVRRNGEDESISLEMSLGSLNGLGGAGAEPKVRSAPSDQPYDGAPGVGRLESIEI